MDIKPERKTLPSTSRRSTIDSSSFNNYFQSWIGSRKCSDEQRQLIHGIEVQDISPIKVKRAVELKNNNFRARNVEKTPKHTPLAAQSSNHSKEQPLNFKSLMAKKSVQPTTKLLVNPTTAGPVYRIAPKQQSFSKGCHPGTKCAATTTTKMLLPQEKQVRATSTTKKVLNPQLMAYNKDTSALTLSPQSNATISKAMLITPPIFKTSNTFEELLSDDEDDDIREQLLLDKAFRKVFNNRKTTERNRMQAARNNIKAVPSNVGNVLPKQSVTKANSTNLSGQCKSVQTKFTCNDNICGIIDTQDFNINCFYCYDIFPINKWSLFLQHMKKKHHLNERTEKIADALLSSKPITSTDTKTKLGHEGITLTGQKRQRQCLQNEPDSSATPSRKIIVPDLNVKCIKAYDNESNMDFDFKSIEIDSTQSPSPVKKFFKLMPPNGNKSDNLQKLPQNLAIVQINKSNLSDIAIADRHDVPSFKPSAATSKCYNTTSNPSKTSINNLDLSDMKKKTIKLPANMKIVKEANMENSNKESPAIIVKKPEMALVEGTPQSCVVDKLLTPERLKEKEDNDASLLSEGRSSPESLLSVIPYWDSEEDMSSGNELKKSLPTLTKNCGDTKETAEIIVENSVMKTPPPTTPSPSKSMKVDKPCEPIIKTTIEAIPPKVSPSSSPCTVPFPSRYLDSEDEMPSNDENEDETPSSTNGCGILFGLTNRKIVTEFLRELKKYPELYKFSSTSKTAINCNDSIVKLRMHINETFNIDMTAFEVRLSIQRIKYWFCRTLQKMEYCKRSQSKKPFKHTFPEYFKIMEKFLSYDVSYTKDLILGRRLESDGGADDELRRYPTWMVCKPGTGPLTPNRMRTVAADDTPLNRMDVVVEDLEFDEDELLTDSEEDGRSASPHTHAPPDPIICDICFVDFNRRLDLRRHRIGHFPPSYPCSTCRRMHYTRRMASKCTHVNATVPKKKTAKRSQPEEKYVCEICGASYKSVGTLNYHKNDKHFNMRLKCKVCNFTAISNYRLVQHQMRRHVVEFGTCEEITKRTRSRLDTKVPFSAEARKEFNWRLEMRKQQKPGDLFFGCYKCKLIFKTRAEKMTHNRTEHPIKKTTVVCLLCQHEKALFGCMNSIRRHYTDIHKVPWDEIDNLIRRTKPLWQMLTEDEISLLNTSDNQNLAIAQILEKKTMTDDVHNGKLALSVGNVNALKIGRQRMIYHRNAVVNGLYDDESNDEDLDQSTLYNDFEVNPDCDDIHQYSDPEEYDGNDVASEYADLVSMDEFNDNARELYIVDENYGNDYFDVDMVQETPAATAQHIVYDDGNMVEQIIEDEIIVEGDFNEYVMVEEC